MSDDSAFEVAAAPVLAVLAAGDGHPGPRIDFARSVLRRVPPARLASADAARVASAVAAVFSFVDGRQPDRIGVRLVQPDVTLDGWCPAGTVVEVSCEDRQFIVTTVKEELHRLGHRIVREIHPVYGAERDESGRLATVLPARGADHRESLLQIELAGTVEEEAGSELIDAIQTVLGDVFAATGDYAAMRRAVVEVAAQARSRAAGPFSAEEVVEATDLLEWLLDGHFVLAGCCRMAVGGVVEDALGVLRRPGAVLRSLPPGEEPPGRLLRIAPTSQISTVYRQVPMHAVDVVLIDPDAEVTGLFRLVGVFTRKANAEPASITPVLRFKLRRILESEDVVEGSQDELSLTSLFQVLPKDELFQADVPSLRQRLLELLAAEEQHGVWALLQVQPATSTVSVLLSVPAELYNSALRRRVERFLMAQLDGDRIDTDVVLGDRPEAILRLLVHVPDDLPDQPLDAVGRELRLLCRTWDQELASAVVARTGEERGRHLVQAWADWFPAAYRDVIPPHKAVDDVLGLDALGHAEDGILVVLADDAHEPGHARLKIFTSGRDRIELSRFVPILESLGLWAVEDRPHTLGSGGDTVHLHDFLVTDPTGSKLDVAGDGPRLAQAALALWHGRAEVDSLNRLVLRSTLSWGDVAVLRAYRRYRSQVGTAFTTGYVDQVLVDNAPIAAGLVQLFSARFDPAEEMGPGDVADLRQRVVTACDAVARLDHDRILRGFLALVDATLRTNRYLGRVRPRHLTLKLDSHAVPDAPRPVPYREIFVHGPSVEGVHLRWGPVARGGIRWSDRPDDYRSEVLDLMRAQVLKNALIVPTGAKGGFIVKRPADGSVKDAYETFVSCLLDVTDNVVGDEVVPVPRRGDGDDPYLVVAPDKGTASFSDCANRISTLRGFWLDDGFASGGSGGYDHKRLGITARGAWVSVTHHFADLDVDLATESVTVVGIGDMSGDVFGNAMLRSERIQLVAAFDHRDIFVDPDPDPLASYRERSRLYALSESSWQDYDRSLLSPGGGVWSRLEKRISLSDRARAALLVDAREVTAPELIKAILRAPVDLLFTGGIGTFVRASTEPDQRLDDRRNSEVRVEGASIRARVVGEGANLAFTQRARVEYARRGGRINTDAIDNSAGVDISDHEVNLKILLRLAVDAGELTTGERSGLLAEVCEEVVEDVLLDSALQSTLLTRAHASSPDRMEALDALLAVLEADEVVDRDVEALPTPEEMHGRAQAGAGLTRPELAVLTAGAKRSLAAVLLASPVPEQPALRSTLVSYFPDGLTARFGHLLERHRLRRDLIASVMANDVVNRMGPTFVTRLSAETGDGPDAVVAAYWAARGVAGGPGWWGVVDAGFGNWRTEALVVAADAVSALLEALTRYYLRRGETDDIAALVAGDRPTFVDLEGAIGGIGSPHRRRLRARRAQALADSGLEPTLSARWACLRDLDIGPSVAELARVTGRPATGVAQAMLQLGESLGIDRLVDQLGHTTPSDRWSLAAWRGLLDDLDDLRRLTARRALDDHPEKNELDAVLRFLAARTSQVAEVNRLLREIEADAHSSLDALTVATRAVRRVID